MISDLAGARMVTATESERGHKLNEALIKSLTGNDRISARYLFKEFFDFVPVAKIFLGTNHKPEIRGSDQAIWDRLVLIPFDVTIPREERDRDLGTKLQAEAGGIFAWMLNGCLDYQERSELARPHAVTKATDQYHYDMDLIGRWFEETLVAKKGKDEYIGAKSAYTLYVEWCEGMHERPVSLTAFGEEMTRRGVEKKTIDGRVRYLNLALKSRKLRPRLDDER